MLACPQCGCVQRFLSVIFPKKLNRFICDSCGGELSLTYKPSAFFQFGITFIYGYFFAKLMSSSDVKLWLIAIGSVFVLDCIGRVRFSTLSVHDKKELRT